MLSLFRSLSSRLLVDRLPHICISISASRCSNSHCCWLNLTLIAAFSDSTVCSLSRSLLISVSRASWEPKSGVSALDTSCVILSHCNVIPEIKMINNTYWYAGYMSLYIAILLSLFYTFWFCFMNIYTWGLRQPNYISSTHYV